MSHVTLEAVKYQVLSDIECTVYHNWKHCTRNDACLRITPLFCDTVIVVMSAFTHE